MTDLTITDENYLANYERLEKNLWFQRSRGRFVFCNLGIIIILLDLFNRPENTIATEALATPETGAVYYNMIHLFSLAIFIALFVSPFFERYASLKKISVMREFERQFGKVNSVYSFDEKGVEILYGSSRKEYTWNMFQTITFSKQFLFFTSEVHPSVFFWVYVSKENEAALDKLVTELRAKFEMRLVK
jgi:hypothetical protein